MAAADKGGWCGKLGEDHLKGLQMGTCIMENLSLEMLKVTAYLLRGR
jgi:hypothetical protein